MAVDSLINKVTALVQGASTANAVSGGWPVVADGGVVAGADHLVLGADGSVRTAKPVGDVFEIIALGNVAYLKYDATYEAVVEVNWVDGAVVLNGGRAEAGSPFSGWSVWVAPGYMLKANLTGSIGAPLTFFVGQAPTKVHIRVAVVTSGVDLLYVTVTPEGGNTETQSTFFETGLIGGGVAISAVQLPTNSVIVGGARPSSLLEPAAPASFSASLSHVQRGFAPASAKTGTVNDSLFRLLWQLPVYSGLYSAGTLTLTLAQVDEFGATVSQLTSTKDMAGFSIGTGVPAVVLDLVQQVSGSDATLASTAEIRLTVPVKSLFGGWKLAVSGTATLSSGSTQPFSSHLVVANSYGGGSDVSYGTFYSGSGQQDIKRLTLTKTAAGDYTVRIPSMRALGSTQSSYDLHIGDSIIGLEAKLIAAFYDGIGSTPVVTAAYPTPTQVVYTITTPDFREQRSAQVSALAAVAAPSGVSKLYAMRATQNVARTDTGFPALPWPTSNIDTGTGGGGAPSGAILALTCNSLPPVDEMGKTLGNSSTSDPNATAGKYAGGFDFDTGGYAPAISVQSGLSDFAFGTGPLTIMGWATVHNNLLTVPGEGQFLYQQGIYGESGPGVMGLYVQLYNVSVGVPPRIAVGYFASNGSVAGIIDEEFPSAVLAAPSAFFHLAYVRQAGGGANLYVNGISVGSATDSNSYPVPSAVVVGRGNSYLAGYGSPDYIFKGKLDDCVVTNTAVYTANFTPPGAFAPGATGDVLAGSDTFLDDFLGTATLALQSNFPDSYIASDVTLDDFTLDQIIVIDADQLNTTANVTLAAFTGAAAVTVATPVNWTADSTLADFTSAAAAVASTPIDTIADAVLSDVVSDGLILFLSPEFLSADQVLEEFTSDGGIEVQEPNRLYAEIVMPAFRVAGTIVDGVATVANIELPAFKVSGRFGGGAEISLPMFKMAGSATVSNVLRAEVELPAFQVQAKASVAGQATANITLPAFQVSGYFGMGAAIELPAFTAAGSITAGSVLNAAIELPAFVVAGSISQPNTLRAEITLPAFTSGGFTVARITLPVFQVAGNVSPVLTAIYETYVVNMSRPMDQNPRNNFEAKVDQVTRYTNYPFTQVVRYGNRYYGVAADGLYLLEGDTDNGAAIEWAFETCMTDFGATEKKNVASTYVGGETGPVVNYTIKSGDATDQLHASTTTHTNVRRNHRQKYGLGRRSRYYALGLAGQGELAVDSIEFEVATTSRRI